MEFGVNQGAITMKRYSLQLFTLALTVDTTAAFVPTNIPARSVHSNRVNDAIRNHATTSIALNSSWADGSFPVDDSAVRRAYDEWRLAYGRGAFDPFRFENFKQHFINLTKANMDARNKAFAEGRPEPRWMTLNEYGDFSITEYEAMIWGEGPPPLVEESAPQASSQSQTTEYSFMGTEGATQAGELDQFGRPIRSTEVIRRFDNPQQTTIVHDIQPPLRPTEVVKRVEAPVRGTEVMKRRTLHIPGAEAGTPPPRSTRVVKSVGQPPARPTEVIRRVDAERGTKGTKRYNQAPVGGTEIIGRKEQIPSRGTRVVKKKGEGVTKGTRAVKRWTGESAVQGTRVVKKKDERAVQGTRVVKRWSGDGMDQWSMGDGATQGTRVVKKIVNRAMQGTRVVKKKDQYAAQGTKVIKKKEGGPARGTRDIQKNANDSAQGPRVIQTGQPGGPSRGTRVVSKAGSARSLETTVVNSSQSPLDAGNADQQTGPKDTTSTAAVTQNWESEPDSSSMFSFFGGAKKSGNASRTNRRTIVIQNNPHSGPVPRLETEGRKTIVINKEELGEKVPSVFSFFGGAKTNEMESVRDPNARATLVIKKSVDPYYFSPSGGVRPENVDPKVRCFHSS